MKTSKNLCRHKNQKFIFLLKIDHKFLKNENLNFGKSNCVCEMSYDRGGSSRSNPYFKAKPKLFVFENRQFSWRFFGTKNFQTNEKCYREKVWKFFWLSKNFFFPGQFFWKQIQKKFGNFFEEKSFSKCFLDFCSKKYPEKKFFLSVKNTFPNLFPIAFYISLNIFVPKKSLLNCLFFKTNSFGFDLK